MGVLPTSPRVRRRIAAVCAALLLATAPSAPVSAQSGESPAERAAREIAEARDRANRAADAWAEAQSDLDQLEVDLAGIERDIEVLEAKVADLQTTVQQAAINRFVSVGSGGVLPLLSGLDGPSDQAQADVFAAIATDVSAEAFDDFDAAAEELAGRKAEFERASAETKAAQEYLERVEAEAYAEVENLREIEQERLADEAVQRALAAQAAERRRQAEALAAQQAAAQQVAAPSAGAGGAGGGASGGSSGPANGGSGGSSTGAGGGTVDGGGSGGSGSSGAYVDGILCPVAGPSAFGDTWGAPRSGGRRHEGVDMLGPTGTPLVAVVSGFATFSTNTLGGNAVSLSGANGNRYYYAHLSAWEGSSRSVSAGEVIGYMGDTGNATGTPHLHFEIRPGGGPTVNPYPSVAAAC